MRQFFRCSIFLITFFLLLQMAAPFAFGTDSSGKINIVIDPGHGGVDGGASRNDVSERECALIVAEACRDRLLANGNFNVWLTRETNDINPSFVERALVADEHNADLLISIHFDSSTVTSLRGATALVSVLDRFKMDELGEMILDELSDIIAPSSRRVNARLDTGDEQGIYYWNEEYNWDIPADRSAGPVSDYYGIITWCAKFGIPSLIMEHGYISNYNDRLIIGDEDSLIAMGQADADAIIAYYTDHTHKWGDRKTDYPASCVFGGKTSRHCEICDARCEIKEGTPDSSKHYWVREGSVAAKCGKEGFIQYYCRYERNLWDKGYEACSDNITVQTIPAKEHAYVLTKDVAVTHTTDGIKEYTCTNCWHVNKVVTKAEGHRFQTTRINPTCEKDGEIRDTCTICGETSSKKIPAAGHDFTVTTKPAACEKDGVIISVCNVCKFRHEETIPAIGHDLTHTRVDPDCTNEGQESESCTRCDYEKITPIPPLGHTLTPSVVNPTCESEGSITDSCMVCDYAAVTAIPALGHDYDTGTVTVEAGLFSPGILTFTCKNDASHSYTEEIPQIIDSTILLYTGISAGAAAVILTAAVLIMKKCRSHSKKQASETVQAEEKKESAPVK